MPPTNTWQTWVKYAHNDIKIATNEMSRNLNPKSRPFEGILYHCQQCAEKMLKAYLIYKGTPMWGHDLEMLRGECAKHDTGFNASRLINHCIFLSAFIGARYPDFTMTIDASNAARGINGAKRVYDFVSEKLGEGRVFFPD